MGMRVGEHCPECGNPLAHPHRSQLAITLIHCSLCATLGGIGFSIITGLLIIVHVLPFTLPFMIFMHLSGFICALMARRRLKRDHCYDQAARTQLQIGYYSPIILLAFFTLFIGADLLLDLIYSM